jgi:hypothetical protein
MPSSLRCSLRRAFRHENLLYVLIPLLYPTVSHLQRTRPQLHVD